MEFGEYFAIVYQNCSKLELQIREGIEDNSKIIFLISQDGSTGGSQKCFYGEIWLIILNNPCFLLLSGAL